MYLCIYLSIYLSMQGLICGTQDLRCCVRDLQLRHVLVVVCKPLVGTCGIQFPDQGLNLGALHWECRVLATGPPGKSHLAVSYIFSLLLLSTKNPTKCSCNKHDLVPMNLPNDSFAKFRGYLAFGRRHGWLYLCRNGQN